MFIERLVNQGNAPLLERTAKFHAARHKLLAENIANASTPGYRQKDLSVDQFQQMRRDRVDSTGVAPPGTVTFDDVSIDVDQPGVGLLFHDGNNRSMEQLMSDSAKNAIFHNLMVEMLRKQFGSIEAALQERVT